jgi:hypothetical protein
MHAIGSKYVVRNVSFLLLTPFFDAHRIFCCVRSFIFELVFLGGGFLELYLADTIVYFFFNLENPHFLIISTLLLMPAKGFIIVVNGGLTCYCSVRVPLVLSHVVHTWVFLFSLPRTISTLRIGMLIGVF